MGLARRAGGLRVGLGLALAGLVLEGLVLEGLLLEDFVVEDWDVERREGDDDVGRGLAEALALTDGLALRDPGVGDTRPVVEATDSGRELTTDSITDEHADVASNPQQATPTTHLAGKNLRMTTWRLLELPLGGHGDSGHTVTARVASIVDPTRQHRSVMQRGFRQLHVLASPDPQANSGSMPQALSS